MCKKILPLVLVLFSCSFIAKSQTAKSLLWKISGNGLKQPSFLFGTMHITDKRLFVLGDSLYSAIENTEGFAIEINPDELAAYVLNNLFEGKESSNLRSVINKAAYEKYSDALSKKIGIPAEDITVKDVVREKNKWVSEYISKGEMPTFLDAFLYNIAKRQGKWVGGIEDLSDQTGLMDGLVDESDIVTLVNDEITSESATSVLEKMISTYLKEDLDGIEQMSYSINNRDALLIKRNIKMARRMDSLSAIRTMFFAVGAAHLPGDSGVISLLRKRGFTVTPVISSKKTDIAQYKFKEVELPWVNVQDTVSFYTVMMPSAPTDINLLGFINMKFMIDITNASAFCTMAINASGTNEDAVIASFSKSFSKGKKGKTKTFERNGLKITEYNQKGNDGNMMMQVFTTNSIVYIAMIYSSEKQTISPSTADKFFNSYQPTAVKNVADSYTFSENGKDVTFRTPVKMSYSKSLSKSETEGWKNSVYTGTDLKGGSFYMFLERQVDKGYHLENFPDVLEEMKNNLSAQITDIITEGERSFKNGSGYYIKAHSAKSKDIITHILYAYRDNRLLMFSVIGDENSDAAFEAFFNSIELLPYKKTEWALHKSVDGMFAAYAPSAFEWNYSADSSSRQMITYDEASSTTIYIFTDTLSKYYWTAYEDSLWSEKIRLYDTRPDSVTHIITTKNGEAGGKEIWLAKPGGTINRMRMFRDGDVIYYISAYAQEAHLRSPNIDRFYNELQLNHPVKQYDITSSKTKQLLSALSDTATLSKAYQALLSASFTEADAPLLEEAVFKKYEPVNEYGASTRINYELADHLIRLKSTSLLNNIPKKYESFKKDEDEMKWVALTYLAKWKTQESYNQLRDLLLNKPTPLEYGYEFFTAFEENPDLIAPIYPQLMKLTPDTIFSSSLTQIGVQLMDSGLLEKKWFTDNEKYFTDLASFYFERNKTKVDSNYDYEMYSLVEMLEKIGTPAAIRSLNQWVLLNINFIKKESAIALLKLNQKVDPSVFLAVAKDSSLRVSLYNDLKEINKLEYFPKAYANQRAMAEGEAYLFASDDDEPTSISFLTEKTASYKGKKYRFYLFKAVFEYEDTKSEYLVVTGGYDIAGKNILTENDLGGVYWDKELNEKELTNMLKEWLQMLEESDEETGD